MSKEIVWGEGQRKDLKESLCDLILGELRLFKSDHPGILDICREVYIEDECPDAERQTFIQFAEQEIQKAAAELELGKSAWEPVTDCDRLDSAEKMLAEKDILLWQVSPCCDTCTGEALPDRVAEVDRRYPGFAERVRGYAFFIEQNLADMLAEDTQISVYLAYGWFLQDNPDVTDEEYEKNALDIGHEVCDCLRQHKLEVTWDGDFSKKIGVRLNWQRRAAVDVSVQ